MESMLSANEKQSMVSSFLEIAVGQTPETAVQFLQATSWNLDEAIQLFYVGNECGAIASASHSSPEENSDSRADQNLVTAGQEVGDEVRPPLRVVRDTLYDDAMLYGQTQAGYRQREPSLISFRNFNEETKWPGVWESEQGAASPTETSRDNLASLYRPPFHLMFSGSFEKLLWSFCYSQLEGAETKPFRLTHAIPGASKSLDYDSKLTFEESKLSNSMISVAWE